MRLVASKLQCRVLEASVTFRQQPFVRPLILSSGTIHRITQPDASVRVAVAGREATGRGSIYLSDLWAWPDPAFTHEQRDAIMRQLCTEAAGALPHYCGGEASHPLELGLRLHEQICARPLPRDTEVLPPLAREVCLSPFDAAVHDAAGIALGCSAFAFYQNDVPIPSADHLFEGGSACAAVRGLLRARPVMAFAAWLVVNKNDDLNSELPPWIARGYRCFKLKIMGQDNATDVARTIEVYRTARRLGVTDPHLTIDSNEANPDAASVMDYLQQLRASDEQAFAALQYVEQPTARDIERCAFDWRAIGALKPVLLDEGLTGMKLLRVAAAQGWTGLALKTCKGHSFSLIAAAWAKQQGMLLSLQDLTNPGLSALHAFLLAAHVPTINGVELNSLQFTPAANASWLPWLAGLFEPQDGMHRLDVIPRGLGSTL